jgi:hypothetical protein
VAFIADSPIPAGGKIFIELQSTDWSVAIGAPVVNFTFPSGTSAAATYSSAGGLKTVTVTLKSSVAASQQVSFVLGSVLTPSGLVGAQNAALSVADAFGALLDDAVPVALAVEAGSLAGPPAFEFEQSTSGMTGAATLSFSTHGAVPVGGSVVVEMPLLSGVQSAWSFAGGGVQPADLRLEMLRPGQSSMNWTIAGAWRRWKRSCWGAWS